MRARLVVLALIALLPSRLKTPCYRYLFGYQIGKRVRVGLSVIDADWCRIDDDVVVGHFNLVTGMKRLSIGDHARIGHFNIMRGGDEIGLGRYSEVLRMNEINSIPDPRVENDVDPMFVLGAGATITAGHKIDFTDRVEIGRRSVLGGRHSSLWTHNRQQTRPVTIGSMTYVGSEIRMAPGSALPSRCIVGIGSVITRVLETDESFIAGVPARVVRPLSEEDQPLIEWKSRPDLPDDL
jgi:acetyltransferase-like isoleucine patch superfamily enzyme